MTNQLFFVGVKGLIQNNAGEYLLLFADVTTHRKKVKPYWDIPGGRIKEGEDFIQTLTREIYEETGITEFTNATMVTTVKSNHSIPYRKDGLAGLVLVIYLVKVPEGIAITISDEHQRFEWVNPTEAKNRLAQKYPSEFTDLL